MNSSEERQLILRMIASGIISADEELQLLKVLEEAKGKSSPVSPLSGLRKAKCSRSHLQHWE